MMAYRVEMELTMVDDAIFQEGLTQMNPLLRVIGLSDLHQPRHKLTKKRQKEDNKIMWGQTKRDP